MYFTLCFFISTTQASQADHAVLQAEMPVEKMIREYQTEMEIALKGFPMEEGEFLKIHDSILRKKKETLVQLLASSRVLQVDVDKLLAEFEGRVGEFEVVKIRAKGGMLLKFSQENYRQSETACDNKFKELYRPIQVKVTTPGYMLQLFAEDVQKLEQQFMSEAVGPAKSNVYIHYKSTLLKLHEDKLRSKQLEALQSEIRKKVLELDQEREHHRQTKNDLDRELQLHRETKGRLEKLQQSHRDVVEAKTQEEARLHIGTSYSSVSDLYHAHDIMYYSY